MPRVLGGLSWLRPRARRLRLPVLGGWVELRLIAGCTRAACPLGTWLAFDALALLAARVLCAIRCVLCVHGTLLLERAARLARRTCDAVWVPSLPA